MEIVYAIFEQVRRFFGMSGLIEIIKSGKNGPLINDGIIKRLK